MTPQVGPDRWDTDGPRDAVIAGLWERVDHLEHEVSRLRECRDVWKRQAEALSFRLPTLKPGDRLHLPDFKPKRGLRAWLARRRLIREYHGEIARDPHPHVIDVLPPAEVRPIDAPPTGGLPEARRG